MRYFAVVLTAMLCLGVFSSAALAQESYYIRQNGQKYQQKLALASTCDNNIRSVQASIGAKRAAFNRGMASKNLTVRSRAKSDFSRYINRLINTYHASIKAYSEAVYYGQKYAAGLMQLRSRAAQGRQVAAQVRGHKNALQDRRNTMNDLYRERGDAARRN